MIKERTLHQIWVGPHPRPQEWMDTWKEKNPEWDYILWNEDNIKGFTNQKLINTCMEKELYHGVADLVRYEVLYNHGGFVAPADSECLEPIDPLMDIEEEVFACWESERRMPGLMSPHLGATKGNELMSILIDRLSSVKDVIEPWKETGNQLLTDVVNELDYPIKIYPSHYFIPNYRDGSRQDGKAYADHKWYTTKKLWK